jgi:hypothetical protein
MIIEVVVPRDRVLVLHQAASGLVGARVDVLDGDTEWWTVTIRPPTLADAMHALYLAYAPDIPRPDDQLAGVDWHRQELAKVAARLYGQARHSSADQTAVIPAMID